jgi:hypothetical protein
LRRYWSDQPVSHVARETDRVGPKPAVALLLDTPAVVI